MFAFQPGAIPFTAAIGLMLLLAAVQALALGDFELPETDADATPLDWLNAGRIPAMALIILFLASFGILGLALQGVAQAVTGATLPLLLAVPAALIAALPVTRWAGRLVGRVFPRTETTAISRDALVGLRATVTTGTARTGLPAPARVQDRLGGTHHVLVEPEAGGAPLPERSEVLLLRRDGELFRAIAVAPHPFLLPDGDLT